MKLNGQPQPDLQHFSHPHPLRLYNHQPQQQTLNLQQQQLASCACCKLNVSGGWIYSCTPCNYFLHIPCSQMPQQITHPYDHQSHVLILIPTPTNPDGVFSCDACMKHGNGFAYHCGVCSIDLHPSCASKPLILTHQSHPHQLSLSFSRPPGFNNSKTFICNICNQVGYKEWLYMCNPCGFTAHLGCVTAKPRAPPPPSNQQIQAAAQAAFVGTPCFPTSTISANPHQFQNYVPNNSFNNNNYNNGNIPAAGVCGQPVRRNKSGKELGKAIVNTAAQVLIGVPIFGLGGNSSQQQQQQPQQQPQQQQYQQQQQQKHPQQQPHRQQYQQRQQYQ
ncbi:rho GTPase-activating protein gacU [Prunus yedoensis var. nudiflora]|uniref:Rho GTPase-activating protein gacU n=1 Tax=Prunus yedoensis var. nudiflora TaxID=2094558 RepID=A0A314ZSE6_PRUYE|nr:rho GTPase-activating protein gacU [Prunus yedoensis var. nudiflora]